MSEETAHKKTALAAAAVYFERRSLVMLALGFASGLPYVLIFESLSVWLREAGLSLDVIAVFSLATLAFAVKFLWAPLVDRVKIPLLHGLLGQRRSWMILAQGLVIIGLVLLAVSDPAHQLAAMAGFAIFVGFSSATQDIAIDAWRIEVSETEKQGAMSAAYQWGYRIALIVAAGEALKIAQASNWHVSYMVMAGLMAIGVIAVLVAPREAEVRLRPMDTGDIKPSPALEALEWLVRAVLLLKGGLLVGSGLSGDASLMAAAADAFHMKPLGDALLALWKGDFAVYVQIAAVAVGLGLIWLAATPLPGKGTRPGAYLYAALGRPLVDFLTRHKGTAGTILALICFYRLSEFVLNINGAAYLDLGFTKGEIGDARGGFGVLMSVIGIGAGGFAIARLGLMRALVIGAFAQPLSHIGFAYLVLQGHHMSALLTALALDNTASAFAGTCLIAYMSSLTTAGFTATQYAMFSSLYALPGKLISSQSGRIVEGLAKNADAGGPISGLKGLMTHLPPESLAGAMAKSHVTPAALGAGYLAFYVYTGLIGLVGIWLAFRVYGLTRKQEAAGKGKEQAPA